MHTPSPENPESSCSDITRWLTELRPASASSLQASVFYRAGYEAARQDLSKTAWRRAGICAMAASVLVASLSGALFFQMGKQSGEAVIVSNQKQKDEPKDAPDRDPELQLAASTEREPSTQTKPSLPPSWFQPQLSRILPRANARVTFLGPRVELGRLGAKLEEIVVIKNDTSLHSPTPSSAEKNQSTPQSLRSLRDNQIKSLMDSLL